jgi:hypothetical protein
MAMHQLTRDEALRIAVNIANRLSRCAIAKPMVRG